MIAPRGSLDYADGTGHTVSVPPSVYNDPVKLARWIAGTGGTVPVAITTATLPAAMKGAPYYAALAAVGGSTPLTWAARGLPAGLTIDADTGVVAGTPGAIGTAPVTVTVTDALDLTSTATWSFTVANAGIDLAGLVGAATYRDGTAVDPARNCAVIETAAAQMAALVPQGRVFCSGLGGVIYVGATVGATTSGALIDGGPLNAWDLANVTFVVTAAQPANVPAVDQPACVVQVTAALSPRFDFTVDGQAAKQLTSTPTNPRFGYYSHGVRAIDCGPIAGTLTVRNIRGVAANTGQSDPADPSTRHAETFHFQNLRGAGGDTITVRVESTDGTDKSNSASGAVWQYMRNPNNAWRVLVTGHAVRHVAGCYAGGTGQFLPGSGGDLCGRLFNLEAGTANAKGAVPTKSITIGDPNGVAHGQIVSHGNDVAVGMNGNNVAGGAQLGAVHVYGLDSIGDARPVDVCGGAPTTRYELHNARVTTPGGAALHYGAAGATLAALQARMYLTACTLTKGSTPVAPAYGATHGTFAMV